jgi:probable HAF family extracellular repeat protein
MDPMSVRRAIFILPGCLTLTASGQSFDFISPAAGLRDTFASTVSDDGRVVHGYSGTNGAPDLPVGYFWSRDTGRADYTLPRTPPAWALTYGGSGDGRFGVGEWAPGDGHRPMAFRYSSASGLETLDEEGVSLASRATDASLDGGTVVGVWERPGFVRQAFVWVAGGGMRGIGVLHPDHFDSEATAVSASGSVVVGSSVDRDGRRHAFRWTAFDGMLELPELAGTGPGGTGALAINDPRWGSLAGTPWCGGMAVWTPSLSWSLRRAPPPTR